MRGHAGRREQRPPPGSGSPASQRMDGRVVSRPTARNHCGSGTEDAFGGTSGRLLWGCRSPDHGWGVCRAVRGGFQLQGTRTDSHLTRGYLGARSGRPGRKFLAASHVRKARQEISRVPGVWPYHFPFSHSRGNTNCFSHSLGTHITLKQPISSGCSLPPPLLLGRLEKA